ncbi:unnamed protein product, partial [Hapterophycus canaliculatus]
VWRKVRSLVGNEADARDCYQTVFLEAFQFSEKTPVEDWSRLLGRIARLRSLDVLRGQYRQADRHDAAISVDAATSRSPSVDEKLDAKELSQQLRFALAEISSEQAEVFVMRYVEQLTYDEIAQRTGSNRNAVGAMLSRARKQLRELLDASEVHSTTSGRSTPTAGGNEL